MDRRRTTWYLERRDIGVSARFAVRCEMRLMIRDVLYRDDRMIGRLDRHMGDIVAGRPVEELTKMRYSRAMSKTVHFVSRGLR